jgi:asparagine synthase (glutamine-hydrolysing)
MCGIAGMMTADGAGPADSLLRQLGDALAHRGPDGHGMHRSGDVGMVQTRLAIIDLETGDQPIHAPYPGAEVQGGGVSAAIVANAEVYNYVELRAHMARVPFATRSDCEPPLHLYLRHGETFAEHLRGMYAIAIHDPANGRLVLARDPFGIKPLYYAETSGGLTFASEPQAFLAAGVVARRLRPAARDELLQLQFTTGAETAFRGINRVLPGETLIVEGGHIVRRLRRAALPAGGPRAMGATEALKNLDEVLNDSVGIHQRSDVPYGMFLSGGIDSSVLLAMMDRLNERPVQAFTIGFPGTAAPDERDHARAVTQAAGAEHVEVDFTAEDFWSLLPRVARCMDDPAADYACLPTYKLAARVHEAGLKVVLTGEGGDELFAGYGRYRRAARWRMLGGRPMRARGAFDGLGVLRHKPAAWRAGIAAAEAVERLPGRTPLQVNQAIDCADWLPNDLLAKLDRCLMAHGIEGRVPLLDPRVADLAFALPDALKVKRGLGKWLPRRWLETGLPESRPFARKRGFTVPVAHWIAERGRDLGPLVAAQPGIGKACYPDAVRRLFADPDRHGHAAWTLLFFALWHQIHILGIQPQGDAMETLAART